MVSRTFNLPHVVVSVVLSFFLVFSGFQFSAQKGRYCAFEVERAHAVVPLAVPALAALLAASGISLVGIMAYKNYSPEDVADALSSASSSTQDIVAAAATGTLALNGVDVGAWAGLIDFANTLADGTLTDYSAAETVLSFCPPNVEVRHFNEWPFTYTDTNGTHDYERTKVLNIFLEESGLPYFNPDTDFVLYDCNTAKSFKLWRNSSRIVSYQQAMNSTYGYGNFLDASGSVIAPDVYVYSPWTLFNHRSETFGSNLSNATGNPSSVPAKSVYLSSYGVTQTFTAGVAGYLNPDLGVVQAPVVSFNPSFSTPSTPYDVPAVPSPDDFADAVGSAIAEHFANNPVTLDDAALGNMSNAIENGINSSFDDLYTDTPAVPDTGILGILQSILQKIGSIPQSIGDTLSKPLENIRTGIDEGLRDLGLSLGGLLSGIDAGIKDLGTTLGGLLSGIDAGIKDLGTTLGGVLEGIDTGIRDLGDTLSGIGDDVLGGLADLGSSISQSFEDIWTDVLEWLDALGLDAALAALLDAVKAIPASIAGIFDTVLTAINSAIDFATHPMDALPSADMGQVSSLNFDNIFPFCLYVDMAYASEILTENVGADFLHWTFDLPLSAIKVGATDAHFGDQIFEVDMRYWYPLGGYLHPVFVLLYVFSVLNLWIRLFLRPILHF